VTQGQQRAHGVLPGDAIGREAHVALELANGRLAVGAKDTVDTPAREPERVERFLQCGDIVPVEVRHAQVQHAIAQSEGGIDECRSRFVADKPVFGKLVLRLERPDRIERAPEEHAVDTRGSQVVAKQAQAALYVLDGSAAIADSHRLHRKQSSHAG
jgi:hypothetical protein